MRRPLNYSIVSLIILQLCTANIAVAQQRIMDVSPKARAASELRDDNLIAQARYPRRAAFSLMPATSYVSSNTAVFTITPMVAGGPNLAVLGSGTIGRLTKWSGLTSSNSFVADSIIFESKTGLIGIGTDTPASKLTVSGMIETILGGYKFPDGSVQTTAATSGLQAIFHDSTLAGNGTQASPLGVAVPLTLSGSSATRILSVTNTGNSGGNGALFSGANNNLSDGGLGISSAGGDTGSANGVGGFGISSKGGNATGSGGAGGIGLAGFGGTSATYHGGNGVRGYGGNGFDVGGNGVEAAGGIAPNGLSGYGLFATGGIGNGPNSTAGDSIRVLRGVGINGALDGLAGFFFGTVEVQGNFNVTGGGSKNFKIDHPLDPENKYLYHAAIESSEVLNIYSGNVTTDERGEAVVSLPDWFEAINSNYRYQLTAIGAPAQGLYIAEKMKNNRFKISGGQPGMEVSWQVTGARSDAAILKHPFKLEEDKVTLERGYYLAPEAYDQPEERSVQWARNPQVMQQLKQQRIQLEQAGKQQ